MRGEFCDGRDGWVMAACDCTPQPVHEEVFSLLDDIFWEISEFEIGGPGCQVLGSCSARGSWLSHSDSKGVVDQLFV